MHFYFKNGQLKMYSEQLIEAPQFEHVERELSADEKDKLTFNCPMKLVNTELQFGEPTVLLDGDVQARKTLVADVKAELNKLPKDKTLTINDLQNIFDLINI